MGSGHDSYITVNLCGAESELGIRVQYSYYPGHPGRMYGDYPEPPEPACVEIYGVHAAIGKRPSMSYVDVMYMLNAEQIDALATEIMEAIAND